MMRALVIAAGLVAMGDVAHAEPPCRGCIVEMPRVDADTRVPLLVVLHGDRERAKPAADRWRVAARKAGFALLALECPRDEGCKDSWWRWNGDPAWVKAQVAAVVATARMIDSSQIFVAGWSGGASYLGLHAAAWSDTFAAIVFHGGGIPPRSSTCAASPVPAYFLVGDKNPLHHLAKALNDELVRCKHEVAWTVVRGADHDGERKALTPARAAKLLAWLRARPGR